MRLREHRTQARRGFTLLELMVVVMILVVLAGVAVPTYMHYQEEAKVKAAYANCETLAKAAQAYQVENGGQVSLNGGQITTSLLPPRNCSTELSVRPWNCTQSRRS